MTSQQQTFSTQEVADIAGVHIQTVRNWIRSGDLKPLPVPKKPIRIPRSELERLKLIKGC